MLFLLCSNLIVMAVPLESFYPFGENNSDSLIGPTLDGHAKLNLTQNFTFFGESYSVIYVSTYCTHNTLQKQTYFC